MKKIVEDFLLERKNAKIKEKLKANLAEDEKQKILDDLDRQFSLSIWLPDAAKRASQLTMSSHPSKFSHPDAKTSSLIAKNSQANDGYLRSGNVSYQFDVFGNAAALDVYKFLTLKTEDGKTILDHLEIDSLQAKDALSIPTANYEWLKQAFLSIKQSDNSNKTDRLVKQVYFPMAENSYHLLSILTPSGLITKVKNKVDDIRFSETKKEAIDCRKENKFHEVGFDDLSELTVICYGGTKPQNISTLNSQNGGRSYLLSSIPPKFEKRKVNLPNYDFFTNVLHIKDFKNEFLKLAKLIKDTRKNKSVRQYRQELINEIINKVLGYVFAIRNDFEKGWSNDEKYQNLSSAQKVWLDDINEEKRDKESDWVDEISSNFARWVIETYEKLNKQSFEMMGDGEFSHLKYEMIEDINKQIGGAVL